jgi:uncharacterized repeat protein (TIGR01451 family)
MKRAIINFPSFVCAALLLLILPAAQSQTAPPYLIVIPAAGEPADTAEMGTQVTIYGSGFCPAGCSLVTLTIGNEIVKPIVVGTPPVGGNGTFTFSYTVAVPFAWRYLITAQQTSATGATVSASVPLIVPQGDEIPEANTQGPEQAEHSAQVSTPPRSNSIPAISAGPLISGVTEQPPNVAFDGRSVSVDVSTSNDAVAIAASESGGLWKTTDSGASWTPLTGLPTFRMSAVRIAPSNNQIVIATAWVDSHVTNGGGLWRSADGGTTWQKPATADPIPGVGSCPALVNQWGIAFSPTTDDVFVGTDCGISISHDLGATWTHVVPDFFNPAVYSVAVQQGTAGSIVDTCGPDGHLRSSDGGTSWTPPSSALPSCPFTWVQTIAVSPLEPNVLFAAINDSSVYESDDAGATWTNLKPSAPSFVGRGTYVATHLSADGNPAHFDIYIGNSYGTFSQTCANKGGPGLRCSTSWNAVTVDHSDNNGLAFSTSSNCAQYMVTDGGVETTSDCGASWTVTGNGTGGYHALQVYEMNGEVHPSSTDLYFGTQDNDLWASANNGSTWPDDVQWEGFFIQTLHDSPSDAGQTITFVACSGCNNHGSAADFTSENAWNNPPGGGGNPFIVSQGVYLQWSAPSPPTNQLYLTTNSGGTWTPVSGASTTLQLSDRIFVSGPPASSTIYQQVIRSGGNVGLIKITGVLSGAATITNADTGLGSIGYWSMGQGTYRFARVFGVDPNNPNHMIAADDVANEMMVSTNGGASWSPDTNLTALVTGFGQFQFSQTSTSFPGITTEAHSIAFDPANGNNILVGTEQAGIMVSTNGGGSWGLIAGSTSIPAVSSFFFDEVQKDVFASSYGRGLWKLNLTQIVTFPPTISKAFGAAIIPLHSTTSLTFTLTNPNDTSALSGVAFSDSLPAGLALSSPVDDCGGTLTSSSGSLALSGGSLAVSGSCTITATVTGTTAGVMNNVTTAVTSTQGGAGNTASASIIVVAPPAITKAFAAPTVPLNHTTTLTFTITNPNTTVSLTGVSFTDTMPAGLTAISTSAACGGTVSVLPGSIILTGGVIPKGSSCTIQATIEGTAAGVENNVTSAVFSVNGGAGNTASATITVVAPPAISKAFGTIIALPVGGTTPLTFTITNPNKTVSLTGVGFTDNLPGMVVSTPNLLTGSCGGGTITAVPGSGIISLVNATLAVSSACTFTVSVTGITEGSQDNITSNVTSVEGGTGNAASAVIIIGTVFEVSYASNLNIGDSTVNLTNAGTQNAESICVNVYAFDASEEPVACCSCLITPDGIDTLSVVKNVLTTVIPPSAFVELLASTPVAGTCDAASPTANSLALGMRSWGTHLQSNGQVTETTFSASTLSAPELTTLTTDCKAVELLLGGERQCGSCP